MAPVADRSQKKIPRKKQSAANASDDPSPLARPALIHPEVDEVPDAMVAAQRRQVVLPEFERPKTGDVVYNAGRTANVLMDHQVDHQVAAKPQPRRPIAELELAEIDEVVGGRKPDLRHGLHTEQRPAPL